MEDELAMAQVAALSRAPAVAAAQSPGKLAKNGKKGDRDVTPRASGGDDDNSMRRITAAGTGADDSEAEAIDLSWHEPVE